MISLKNFKLALILCLLFFFSGCTSKYDGHYKIGAPYTINNVTYYPQEVLNYEKIGYASWYGKKFHGKKTSNGEKFDKNEFTAAHQTLPLPSIVKVTNLENNKSVLVKINDRGPFHGQKTKVKRIIDLSEKAAEKIGLKHAGIAKVKVTLLPHATVALHQKLGIEKSLLRKKLAVLNLHLIGKKGPEKALA